MPDSTGLNELYEEIEKADEEALDWMNRQRADPKGTLNARTRIYNRRIRELADRNAATAVVEVREVQGVPTDDVGPDHGEGQPETEPEGGGGL